MALLNTLALFQLPQVEVKDHPESEYSFELVDKVGGQSLILKAHRERIKKIWLKEIREFAKDHGKCRMESVTEFQADSCAGESEENSSDEFQIPSPPTESANSKASQQESPPKAQEPPALVPEKPGRKETEQTQPTKKQKLEESKKEVKLAGMFCVTLLS